MSLSEISMFNKPKTIADVQDAATHLAACTSAPIQPPSLVHGYNTLQSLKSTRR